MAETINFVATAGSNQIDFNASGVVTTGLNFTGTVTQRGEGGEQGESAYDVWLGLGNVGTEQDFIDSLQGEQGDPATNLVTSVAGKQGVVTLTSSDVGLGDVNNTSDANKPISTATQTALNGKEPTITAGTTSQYWRGDKSWQTLDKTAVGLSNVPNTDATNRANHTGTQTASTISDLSETVEDIIGTKIVAGSNVTVTYNDTTGETTIASSGGGGGTGITRSITVTSGSFTAGTSANTDYVYLIAGNHTPTLPTAVGNTNRYTFKNNHSANITIGTTSSQTIDGTTSIQIAPEESVDVISTNSNWSII